MPEDLRQKFLNGMSQAAATVNIVTTDGPAGRHGVTVSAMASVSADTERPTMLVCVNKKSGAADPIRANGVFYVNVLRNDQSHISDCFAGRTKQSGSDKFGCAQWAPERTGAPRVIDPLVGFDCRLLSAEVIGTHYVFVGAVEDVYLGKPGLPLIYANRTYGTPTLFQTELSADDAANKILRVGTFHTLGPVILPKVLQRLASEGKSINLQLVEGDQRTITDSLRTEAIDLALIYDWDLGPSIQKEHVVGLDPHVLLAADHPLAKHKKLSLRDIIDLPMVLLDAPPSDAFFLSLFTTRGLSPSIRYRTKSLEMVRGLVGSGLGYSILVTKIKSDVAYGGQRVVTLPLSDVKDSRQVTMAFRRDHELGSDAQLFLASCRDVLRSEWSS